MGGSASYGQSKQRSSQGSESHIWDAQAPYLEQLYGMGANMAGAPAPNFDPGTMNAWQSALTGQINPTTGAVIDNATRELGLDFQRNVMPGIRSNAVSSGAVGGSREGVAEGLAAGEASRAMGNLRASMTNAALDRATQQQTAALGLSPAFMQLQGSLPWTNINEFAKVLGAPAVVGSSYGQSRGDAFNTSASYSETGKS